MTAQDVSDEQGRENERAGKPKRRQLTRAQVLALPAVVDVETAAAALGFSRTQAYELIRADEWPTDGLYRAGKLIKIPTAPILRRLGLDAANDQVPRQEAG